VKKPDVIVVGAGIVGAACAAELQALGRDVLLIDGSVPGGGVTAAGMGHLVALDETDDELDLCLLSLARWDAYLSTRAWAICASSSATHKVPQRTCSARPARP
jgi:glycine/D-amino acid oxidase-like deaminating enzyme